MDIVVKIARIAHYFYLKKGLMGGGKMFFKAINRIIFSCDIAYQVDLPSSTKMPHQGLGVVIHPNTIIGEYCTIYQNVTLGANGKKTNGNFAPQIGCHVMIGAGTVIIGNVKIGDFAMIGANSVVLSDVPTHAVVVGIPARIKYITK